MKNCFFALLLASASAASFAQSSTVPCQEGWTLLTVQYGFKDTDAQASWVYRSLNPSISIGSETNQPLSTETKDGVAMWTFCVKPVDKESRLVLRAGPRSYELAQRPIVKGPDGRSKMASIPLLGQIRPDWPIVQSIERLDRSEYELPAYDITILNFGQSHQGGRVSFEASVLGYHCAIGTQPSRIDVRVSLIGQRLKVTSSDPEYPEEQISRVASLETSLESCAPNYRLTADIGPTGRLLPGPNRIRLSFKEASGVGTPRSVDRYFSHGRLRVTGEGIW